MDSLKYKKLTQIEHILLKSGMYVGSKDHEVKNMWILENSRIIQKVITYIPALYKIFDEVMVNAYDQTVEDDTLTTIKVEIQEKNNEISIFNDGKGIPIVIHEKENIYIPELIFSTLLTSSHFEETSTRITGGTYGIGIKVTAIFSSYFKVEVGDPINKKKFVQTYINNLSKKSKPIITDYQKSHGYVKITFQPDLEFFKLKELSVDIISLFKRRVYDISALTRKNVKIYLNEEKVNVKNFYDYVSLFELGEGKSLEEVSKIKIQCSEQSIKFKENRWEIIITPSDGEFSQMSFVNSINTINGGKHVDYILNKLVKEIKNKIKNKYKFYNIKDSFIKDQFYLFLSAIIENPEFSSQTKEELITQSEKFGSSCEIKENIINKIYVQLNFDEKIKQQISASQNKELENIQIKKKSDIKAINKLHDANYAGTKRSNQCTLILTEGDSAKTMAITGISAIPNIKANDYYGIFPLRGKLLNVREATHKQIIHNEEFKNIKLILGLEMGKEYNESNISELRYSGVILFFDADVDGSHIKGLFINMIEYYWPSLLHINGFIKIFITPMIKATKKNETIAFYTFGDFENWKKKKMIDSLQSHGLGSWQIKYYKGLGTSTISEAKEYFKNLDKNTLLLNWLSDKDDDAINLAFAKDQADERKLWLQNYNRNTTIDYTNPNITYSEFIHKELIHFSNYDNIRSIPNIMDGLKPAQRKVLYSAFKKKLTSDIKVAQFVGYISEHTSYHHGENSLAKTIVAMAQNFTGSNNINLLVPNGQFGTRLMGGKDASSPRYIYTHLNDITRYIFHEDDDDLLTYLNDDGFQIEPEFYVPIIPMILVNGTEGIGTGYSTYVPRYDPLDIINNLIDKINGKNFKEMIPWYNLFAGKIEKLDKNIFYSAGKYLLENNQLTITELPLFYWTENFKELLDDMVVNNLISNYKNNSTESIIHFIIKLKEYIPNVLDKDSDGFNSLEKKFGMVDKINLNNMHLHDPNGKIKKFTSTKKILEEFYIIRLDFYGKRKELLLSKLKKQIDIINSKIKFIEMVIGKKIQLLNIPKKDLIKILEEKKLLKLPDEPLFDYLIRMPFYSFTKEKIDELYNELEEKEKLFNNLNNKTKEQLWLEDLYLLRENIKIFYKK